MIVGAANADKIVKIFQQAEDRAAARQVIEKTYKLTPIQSEVIASMTLAQVTRLDASKYAREKVDLQTRIGELQHLLSDRKAMLLLLKKEMQQLIKQFGDERRTTIDVEGQVHEPIKEVASLHEREPLAIAFTRAGTLKALPADTFVPRGKNGAAIYTPVRGDEQLRQVVAATSQDYVLCVSSSGRVFQIGGTRAGCRFRLSIPRRGGGPPHGGVLLARGRRSRGASHLMITSLFNSFRMTMTRRTMMRIAISLPLAEWGK